MRSPSYLGLTSVILIAEWIENLAYASSAGRIIPHGLIGLTERAISATLVTFVKAHQMSSDNEMGLKVGSIQALKADPRDSPMMLTSEPFFRFILTSVTEMMRPLGQESCTVNGRVMFLPVIFAES